MSLLNWEKKEKRLVREIWWLRRKNEGLRKILGNDEGFNFNSGPGIDNGEVSSNINVNKSTLHKA